MRRIPFAALILVVLAAALRLGTLDRQGLWGDEVQALAMATGHSLEHPASVADPLLGDYIEHPGPRPASVYQQYLEHEVPAAGLRRVVRAVFLTDTNPPLYHVLLYGWTLWAGTSDAAVRLFSVMAALACLPLLWSLGKQIGGHSAAWIACALFALAPAAIRYSTDARMYALLWFFVLLAAWSALRLHRRGGSIAGFALFVVASAAGFLTHYFFVFVWGAIWVWLLWQPGRCNRRLVMLSAVGIGILILPWYSFLPASLSNWRVSQDWLTTRPRGYRVFHAPAELLWSFFSPQVWAVWTPNLRRGEILLLLLIGAALLWHLEWRRRWRRSLLLLLWVGAACLGPLTFDLLRGMYTGSVTRYALAGLPAAFLLLAAGLSRLQPAVRGLVMLVLLAVWLPGYRALFSDGERSRSSMRMVAREIGPRSNGADVILIQSNPMSILGLARYMEGSAPIGTWVPELGQRRVPDDVLALTGGYRRVFMIRGFHGRRPQENYLREIATVSEEFPIGSRMVVVFVPRMGEYVSAPAAANDVTADDVIPEHADASTLR
jgi:hypothetical protein